jgi:hypothetical protein
VRSTRRILIYPLTRYELSPGRLSIDAALLRFLDWNNLFSSDILSGIATGHGKFLHFSQRASTWSSPSECGGTTAMGRATEEQLKAPAQLYYF